MQFFSHLGTSNEKKAVNWSSSGSVVAQRCDALRGSPWSHANITDFASVPILNAFFQFCARILSVVRHMSRYILSTGTAFELLFGPLFGFESSTEIRTGWLVRIKCSHFAYAVGSSARLFYSGCAQNPNCAESRHSTTRDLLSLDVLNARSNNRILETNRTLRTISSRETNCWFGPFG
jgi:hypothetical protein